jgi:hypothetical protein
MTAGLAQLLVHQQRLLLGYQIGMLLRCFPAGFATKLQLVEVSVDFCHGCGKGIDCGALHEFWQCDL